MDDARCNLECDEEREMLRHECSSVDEAADSMDNRSTGGRHFEALRNVDTTPRSAVLTTAGIGPSTARLAMALQVPH